jgi:hypothetical protein
MLGCTAQQLWRMAKSGRISAPKRLSTRRSLWSLSELLALGGKRTPPDGFAMTRAGAARILRVCSETISRMVADGRLSAKRENGRLRFRVEDLLAAKEQRRNYERLNWDETAALLGVNVADLMELWLRGRFIRCDSRRRFRRGDIVAWYELYQRTGSLTGGPFYDSMFRHVKPTLRE